jgi:hypothetical protein
MRTVGLVLDPKGRVLAISIGLLRAYTNDNVQPVITEYANGRATGVINLSF